MRVKSKYITDCDERTLWLTLNSQGERRSVVSVSRTTYYWEHQRSKCFAWLLAWYQYVKKIDIELIDILLFKNWVHTRPLLVCLRGERRNAWASGSDSVSLVEYTILELLCLRGERRRERDGLEYLLWSLLFLSSLSYRYKKNFSQRKKSFWSRSKVCK